MVEGRLTVSRGTHRSFVSVGSVRFVNHKHHCLFKEYWFLSSVQAVGFYGLMSFEHSFVLIRGR